MPPRLAEAVTPPARIHFLDEQRRHRRTSSLSVAAVIGALALSGIPLSVVISPVVVAGAALIVRLADLILTVPPDITGWIDRALHLLPVIWTAVRRPDVDLPWGLLAGLFVLPGTLAMVLLWAVVRTTFRRTGVGGVLRRMETRPPRSGDLAEQRLANLVEEVAVAAAVPPPRVLLIDATGANATAAGLAMEDAAVVVTRGFVDRLPRDAQQAVIAHVMASVGNGDLAVAAEILVVLQTWGLVALALEAPFLPSARASLGFVVRVAGETLRGRADARSRELALDLLLQGAGHEHDMDSEEFELSLPWSNPLLLVFVYLPLLVTVAPAAVAAKAVIWLFTLLVSGPIVAFLWRTRRRLADATAVQLTRYPESLAEALRTLSAGEVTVPGAVAVNFLFPIWDPAVDSDQTRTDVASVLLGMHLPLEARLRRLQRLGARADVVIPAAARSSSTLRDLPGFLGWLAVATLLVGALLAVNVVVAALLLYLLGWVLDVVLVTVPGWIARLWS
jgi:Zn-dependent protease with chaperone function